MEFVLTRSVVTPCALTKNTRLGGCGRNACAIVFVPFCCYFPARLNVHAGARSVPTFREK